MGDGPLIEVSDQQSLDRYEPCCTANLSYQNHLRRLPSVPGTSDDEIFWRGKSNHDRCRPSIPYGDVFYSHARRSNPGLRPVHFGSLRVGERLAGITHCGAVELVLVKSANREDLRKIPGYQLFSQSGDYGSLHTEVQEPITSLGNCQFRKLKNLKPLKELILST